MLFYTGLGGAGKTSVAAATALRCAAQGQRTLLLAVDASPSLAETLDLPLGPLPAPVALHLWAQQVNVAHEAADSWGPPARWLGHVLSRQSAGMPDPAGLEALPGIESVIGLLAVAAQAEAGAYAVIVVDGAPTADMLRLLDLASAARRWMGDAEAGEHTRSRLARVLLVRLAGAKAPDDAALASARTLVARLACLRALLIDPEQSAVRLVMTPQRLALAACRRLLGALARHGCAADQVICNQVITGRTDEPSLAARQRAQDRIVEEARAEVAPLPLRCAPLLEREPIGVAALDALGEALYGDHNPAAIAACGGPVTVVADDSGFVLSVPLPRARLEQIKLVQEGDELIVRVGAFRRIIKLPSALRGLLCHGAQLDDETLRLHFARGPAP